MTNKTRLFDAEPYDDTTGALGEPRMTGTVDVGYSYKRWGFSYGLEWVAATDNLPFYQKLEEYKESAEYRKQIASMAASTPDYFLHSASVSYREETWHATFAVRNLLNKTPPRVSAGAADRLGNMLYYSGYDLFGRAYTLSLNKKF
jgi:iron complex outermembrane receptor protein